MIYTTEPEVERVLQRELTEDEIAMLDKVILAAGSAINAYTGRRWLSIGETAEDETRYFDGNGDRELFIDDFMSITSIIFTDSLGKILNTLITSDYLCYPLNTSWKNSVFLRNSRFPRGYGNVVITGKFYTGEPPSEVRIAAAHLVGQMLVGGMNLTDFKKEAIEGYSYEILTGSERSAQEKSVYDRLDFWKKIEI